jgi:hypothetical protein
LLLLRRGLSFFSKPDSLSELLRRARAAGFSTGYGKKAGVTKAPHRAFETDSIVNLVTIRTL